MHLLKSLDYLLPDGLQKNGRVYDNKMLQNGQIGRRNETKRFRKSHENNTG
jgi:hypothetical protein